MGKAVYGLLFAFIIELVVTIYLQTTTNPSSLFNFMTLLYQWDYLSLFGSFNAVLIVAGSTAAIIAGLYLVRNEWIVYAGLSIVFISFGLDLVIIWQYIASNPYFGTEFGRRVIASLFVSPLALTFLMLMLDFSRGKD